MPRRRCRQATHHADQARGSRSRSRRRSAVRRTITTSDVDRQARRRRSSAARGSMAVRLIGATRSLSKKPGVDVLHHLEARPAGADEHRQRDLPGRQELERRAVARELGSAPTFCEAPPANSTSCMIGISSGNTSRSGTRGISRSARRHRTARPRLPVSTFTARLALALAPARWSRRCGAGRRRRGSGCATVIVRGPMPAARQPSTTSTTERAPSAVSSATAEPSGGRTVPSGRSASHAASTCLRGSTDHRHHVGADLRLELAPACPRRPRSRHGRRSPAGRTAGRPPRGSALSGTATSPARCSRRSSSHSAARDVGSTPVVGSSRISSCGRWTSPQARSSRRRMPPEYGAHQPVGGVGQVEQLEQLCRPLARSRARDIPNSRPSCRGARGRSSTGRGRPPGARRRSTGARRRAPRDDVVAGHHRPPGRRPQQRAQHADRGRLARAVRAEQPVGLALAHLERDAADGLDAARRTSCANPRR